MKLNRVTACGGGGCPAVWEADTPDVIVIQGYKLDDLAAYQLDLPPGENAVAVPRSLIEEWVAGGCRR